MNGNISDLLREYGGGLQTGIEESRKLKAALKRRRQPTGFNYPQVFDWEEAKQFGVTLDEGWMLKITPDESERGFAVSYLTPGRWNERWEIKEGGLYISPEGKQYTEEELKAQEAEQAKTEELFGKVFPEKDIQSVLTYAKEKPEEFYGELIKAGKTPETEAMLKAMGASEEFYNYLYMSDEEVANWTAQMQKIGRNYATEALVKSISPEITEDELNQFFTPVSITKEEHEAGIKGFFANFYKGFRIGVASTWENVKTAFTVVYPLAISNIRAPIPVGTTITMPTEEQWKNPNELSKILPAPYYVEYMTNVRNDMPLDQNIAVVKRDIESWNEKNRDLEAHAKTKYDESQVNFNEWLKEHPEFYEPEYVQSSIEHPELLKDPGYYGYTIGNTAPAIMAAFAAAAGVTLITRNPLAGATAGAALFDPINKASIYDDMIANGASPGVAANGANSIGTIVSAVEIVPELVFLRIMAPSFMRIFGRTFQKDLTKQVITNLSIAGTLKGTLTAGGKIMLAETAEELVQQVLQNAAVKTVNENRSLIEGLGDTFIQSVIAIAPFAIVGMGGEYLNMKANLLPEASEQIDVMASKLKAAGLSDDLAEAAALAKLMETEVGEAEVMVAKEKVEAPTKGWETVIWQTSGEEGNWKAQLVGEKSRVILEEQEFKVKPTEQDFKSLEAQLKRHKEIRYDPKTGKYIRVRRLMTRITKANWDALNPSERMGIAEDAGLAREVGRKSWSDLTLAERSILKASGVVLPEIKEAKELWNALSVSQRATILKSLGLEGKLGSKSWQALSRKEKRLLSDTVVSQQIHFTTEEARLAAEKIIYDSIKEETGLTETQDVVQKLTQLINQAEPLRKITEGLKHEELIKRTGRAAAILNTAEGREAFEKSKAALKGELPKADFAPPELQLTSEDITELYERIKNSDMRYFTQLNTAEALTKLLSGNIPTERELALLEDMYGGELVKAILKKRTAGQKAWDVTLSVLNLPRAVLSSWDLSAPLRQGALLFWGQPKESLPAFKPMVKAFFSTKNAQMTDEIIKSNHYYELSQDAGLYIAPLFEVSARLTSKEEAFMSRFTKYIPLISHSERAYVTYLNKMRMDVFSSYARQWEGTGKTMADYKSLATAINTMSGRGKLGALEGMGPVLNASLFSPRYQMSRIRLPYDFVKATPAVRKMMARNIVAFVAANFAIMALWMLSDDDANVETDPRSTDCGKLKIGNTRLDFWAGFQQYFRAVTQIITGMRKVSTTGKLTEVQRDEVLGSFVRSKLSPVPGFVSDILKGESYVGEELALTTESVKQQAFQRLVPMFIQDLIEAIEDSGITGGLIALPGLFGVGVQTYGGAYWNEFIDQLGQPKQSDTLPYSVNKEDIYDTKDFYGDMSSRVSGIRPEDIDPKYNIPDLVQSVIKAKAIKEEYQERPSSNYVNINADITKGDTFEEYFLQWQLYQKATTDKERAEIKEKYPQYYMGNFSRQTLALLREYHSLDKKDRAGFLKDHPELRQNPREEWLKSHPEENALLALWGQAKVFTLEAYKEVNRLIDELDIPGKAVEFNLPPVDSIENYFKYLDTSANFGSNSAEVKRLLLNDDQLREWLGREPVEDRVEILDLQIKNRALTEEYEGYGDKNSPYYIKDDDERKEARELFKSNYPDWNADMYRIDAYKAEFPEELIEDYITWYTEYSKKPEGFEGTWYEDDWWLMEHKDFCDAMWPEGKDFSKVPTREVWGLYQIWGKLPKGQARRDFEASHPDLDMWLHIKFGTKLETE